MAANGHRKTERKFLASGILPAPSGGFTLVEMAMVLIVTGLIILTVFPALNAVRAGSQRSLTQSNLQALMRATAAYVQANGCLPCPTPPAVTGSNFGTVRGDGNPAPCINLDSGGHSPLSCAAEGIPPYVSLGVPASVARDGWGRWISMRIDPDLAVLPYPGPPASAPSNPPSAFAPPATACTSADVINGVCAAAQLGLNEKGICRMGLNPANRVSVTAAGGPAQPAAVLFVSHGANGYGAFIAGGAASGPNGCRQFFPSLPAACIQTLACTAPSACASSDGQCLERCNASGKNLFADAPLKSSYDDVLAYAGLNATVSMLGSNACTAGW